MLTKIPNKVIAGQLGALFCDGQQNFNICKQSVANRIINAFNDDIFENYFLPNIDKGRFYILEFYKVEFNAGTGKTVIEFKTTDVLTNEVSGNWFAVNIRPPVFSKFIPGALSKNFQILNDKNFTSENWKLPRIAFNEKAAKYGIVYVKGTAGNPSTFEVQTTPPPASPVPVPVPSQPGKQLIPGLDLDINSILLIGGIGLAAWYFLKK